MTCGWKYMKAKPGIKHEEYMWVWLMSDFWFNASLRVLSGCKFWLIKPLSMCRRTSNSKPISKTIRSSRGDCRVLKPFNLRLPCFFSGSFSALDTHTCNFGTVAWENRAFFLPKSHSSLYSFYLFILFFFWDSLLLDFPILATCSVVAAKELRHWANKSALFSRMAPTGWIMSERWALMRIQI